MGWSYTKQLLYLFLWINCFVLGVGSASAQGLSNLEQNQIAKIVEVCALDSTQIDRVNALYEKCASELKLLDKEQKDYERSESLTEDEVSTRVAVLFQKKKELRKYRDLEVLELLDTPQRNVYREKMMTQKPQVLHFGIHNRADCKVCLK